MSINVLEEPAASIIQVKGESCVGGLMFIGEEKAGTRAVLRACSSTLKMAVAGSSKSLVSIY
jgi:hypothetical protein